MKRDLSTTISLVGLAILLLSVGTGLLATRSCSRVVSDVTSVTGSKGKATLAAFERIQTGMTYAEVVRIIGGEGSELSRVEAPGIPITAIYGWDGVGSFGANMNVTFQGGRVYMKAQVGLR